MFLACETAVKNSLNGTSTPRNPKSLTNMRQCVVHSGMEYLTVSVNDNQLGEVVLARKKNRKFGFRVEVCMLESTTAADEVLMVEV